MPGTVLMTVLNDAFAEYFRVLLFSIKKHNPGFDLPLLILHSETLSPLSGAEQERIRAMHRNVSFASVNEKPYVRFFPVTPVRLHPALLKLDIFAPRGLDRVIFLDADMLCLGDLSELFGIDVPFGAVPAGKDRKKKERLKNKYRFRLGFNSGVLTIGKEHLDGRTHEKLLHQKLRPCPTADQDILIRHFRWRRTWCLDHRYNYHAQFFWRGEEIERNDGVKLLHYAGPKPLEQPREPRMQIWFAYRDEMRGQIR